MERCMAIRYKLPQRGGPEKAYGITTTDRIAMMAAELQV
jgi:hypothetical protein